MKKSEVLDALTNAITASNDDKATKESLALAITEIVTNYRMTASNKVDEHPNVLNAKNEVIEVWCNKHNQYEPEEAFVKVAKSKNGYHNKCRIADYQWKDYLAKIRFIEDELTKAIVEERFDEVVTINQTKTELIAAKDAPYKYPNKTEIIRISPKQKES